MPEFGKYTLKYKPPEGTASHDAYFDCQNALLAMRKMAGEFKVEELTEDMIDLDF